MSTSHFRKHSKKAVSDSYISNSFNSNISWFHHVMITPYSARLYKEYEYDLFIPYNDQEYAKLVLILMNCSLTVMAISLYIVICLYNTFLSANADTRSANRENKS